MNHQIYETLELVRRRELRSVANTLSQTVLHRPPSSTQHNSRFQSEALNYSRLRLQQEMKDLFSS
ncbi:hypothetical protein AXX17_AT5G37990 [Arabidopsis thaliana]|uniref:Uncharacterized protein n=1 Tax=Arabidopsis thaliana TaxID=3702 RepID=A0A178UC66_ARATH|nr:hypothetical protein AXX17_AT5G37990 [Arabidopsis thaliana]